MKQRKEYSREYKLEVARLVVDQGLSVSHWSRFT
jgi:hypothetical protein